VGRYVNVKVVKRLTPLTGEGWRGRGEKGGRDNVTKRTGKDEVKWGEDQGPLATEGEL